MSLAICGKCHGQVFRDQNGDVGCLQCGYAETVIPADMNIPGVPQAADRTTAGRQARVLAALAEGPLTVRQVSERAAMGRDAARSALTTLYAWGQIERAPQKIASTSKTETWVYRLPAAEEATR